MDLEATLLYPAGEHRVTSTTAAVVAGQVIRLQGGRAAVKAGLQDAAVGDAVTYYTEGVFALAKATGVVLLEGTEVYWDESAGNVNGPWTGDYPIGIVKADAASAETTVNVELNVKPIYDIDLRQGGWTTEATNNAFAILFPSTAQLALDNGNEVGQIGLYSNKQFDVDDVWICQGKIAQYNGGSSVVDFDIGVATGTHATDFEAVTAFAALHFDASLDIKFHSDDNTTDVAIVDSTVDAVDDTYFWWAIDGRDKSSLKMYVNGVRVLTGTTFTLAGQTGNLRLVAMVEKTSSTETSDYRIEEFNLIKKQS